MRLPLGLLLEERPDGVNVELLGVALLSLEVTHSQRPGEVGSDLRQQAHDIAAVDFDFPREPGDVLAFGKQPPEERFGGLLVVHSYAQAGAENPGVLTPPVDRLARPAQNHPASRRAFERSDACVIEPHGQGVGHDSDAAGSESSTSATSRTPSAASTCR